MSRSARERFIAPKDPSHTATLEYLVNRRSNAAEELFDALVSRIADAVVERMKSGTALTDIHVERHRLKGATKDRRKVRRVSLPRPVEITEIDRARAKAVILKRGQ